MADPDVRIIAGMLGGWRRFGTPTLAQPQNGVIPLHERLNVDPTSPGRVRGRPAARAVYEKGSAEAANWPRMAATTT